MPYLNQKLLAEAIGTSFLLIAVVGSGIMAEQLANGNLAIALLANAIATGAALFTLISIFAPISGAHFNPLVTFVELIEKRVSKKDAILYISIQFLAAILGVILANLMFDLPAIQFSQHQRHGISQWLGEFVASFGLILTILLGSKTTANKVPALVACYITGAYWFTSSTSFANPAVTFARSFTNTFSGIHPSDVMAFSIAQILASLVALFISKKILEQK